MMVRSSSTASNDGSSSAARSSAADWKRAAGSTSRHFRITWSSRLGMVGRNCDGRGGACCNLANAMAAGVSPVNGGRAHRHSKSTTPSAYTSVRPSTGSPFTCSGARYLTVPSIVPAWVLSGSSRILAMPKSVTSTRSSAQRRMFAGLMSRWTRPARCAAASASATSAPMCTTSRGSSTTRPSSWSRSVVPRTSSMTIASAPSSWEVS